jgi:dTDP-4-dehydrorhamnose 3,5-epimerase
MKFTPTSFADAWTIELNRIGDDRGFFARTWCAETFQKNGLVSTFVQMNTNYAARAGTLKGLHWQADPHGEAKLVRCIAGAVFDVIVDMRPASATYLRWEGFELTAADRGLLYVPPGFAHGFQALEDDVEITYLVGAAYTPAAERGLRFDDPVISIKWPLPAVNLSAKDRSWPDVVA